MLNIEMLKGKTYEEGAEILENEGYVQTSVGTDTSNIADEVVDTYFELFDEDDEVISTISYVSHQNIVDGGEPEIVKEYWEDVK